MFWLCFFIPPCFPTEKLYRSGFQTIYLAVLPLQLSRVLPLPQKKIHLALGSTLMKLANYTAAPAKVPDSIEDCSHIRRAQFKMNKPTTAVEQIGGQEF